MNELTERQKFLLTLMIHEYIRLAQPIGSQALVERYKLEMSSATVRNELAALDEMGYLRQPHTSAGRVPTEEGYRYFVSRLIRDTNLPESTRSTISHQFYQMREDVEQWVRLAASVLANQTRVASLVTSPHPEKAHFKHLELISIRGRQVLMVLVMVGGEVHQRILTLAEPIAQEQLTRAAAHLTQKLQGCDSKTIQSLRSQFDDLEADVINWVLEEMTQSNAVVSGEVFIDGLSYVLAEPEFAGSEDARRALHFLEERPRLESFLSRSLPQNTVGGVQVLIGGESTLDELRQFSVVLARYGAPGLATGMLGVLGPMRMPYGRSISVVRFVSGLLSDLISETLVDEQPDNLN
ncbi:MAG TPA: heat-inducible transcriptional repressor HrcA [Longilinea sp.]|nr:heat-inducible transcriptional repressor HrcA [Longilinea sp.]